MAKRPHMELNYGINALPDELLVSILCFLSLKEAAATSILCRRWRHLWTFTDKLDFDGTSFYRRVWLPPGCSKNYADLYDHLNYVLPDSGDFKESRNYITWVDNILGIHKSTSIQEFRVDFSLTKAHKHHIKRWLRFAAAKKVERLDLNLSWKPEGFHKVLYAWPSELSTSFKHLRQMRMRMVNLSGEDLELLLGTCPLLEELSVRFSKKLGIVKITGPSLALKRLEIDSCHVISLEIHDAINLVCLIYLGRKLQQFVLKNVPLLVEMQIGGAIVECMKSFILMFSSYLPSLKKLTINSFYTFFIQEKEAKMFYNNVKMSNLEQLVFKFYSMAPCKFKSVTYLIRASPLLQSFVLEAYGGDHPGEEGSFFVNTLAEMEGWNGHEYPHLKRVELVGYRGTILEQELAIHLLQNAAALEEFIVDLRKRDNAWMINNVFLPNAVTGKLPIGYHCNGQDEVINAIKARVKDQLTMRLPSTLQHLNLKVL